MSNYFDQKGFISNSELGELKKLMRNEEEMDLTDIYNFGSLVHGFVTEPHKIDHENKALVEGENKIYFSDDQYLQAQRMYEAAKKDKVVDLFLKSCKKEHEFYRKKFKIEYKGYEVEIPVRAKLDFLNKGISIGADLKGIKCDTRDQFITAIEYFDYDRQAAWYMDIANLDQFMFIGLSKKKNPRTGNHDVFKFVMIRGDENYQKGKAKYSRLAFYYFHLIYNLNVSLNEKPSV